MGSTNRISLLEIESNECGNDLEPKRKYILKHAHLCLIIWSTSLSNWFKYRVLMKDACSIQNLDTTLLMKYDLRPSHAKQ